MYLFKRIADGVWIFGSTAKSICPAGAYRLETSPNNEGVTIHAVFNRDISLNYGFKFSDYKKENGEAYSSIAEFEAGTTEFFSAPASAGSGSETGGLTNTELRASAVPVINNELLGVWGDKVNPAGAAKYTAPAGFYFYAASCRVDGSKIASCEKNVSGTVSADATDSYIGVAMYQGEYHPFVNKIVSVTLTNATDQLQYWLKPL